VRDGGLSSRGAASRPQAVLKPPASSTLERLSTHPPRSPAPAWVLGPQAEVKPRSATRRSNQASGPCGWRRAISALAEIGQAAAVAARPSGLPATRTSETPAASEKPHCVPQQLKIASIHAGGWNRQHSRTWLQPTTNPGAYARAAGRMVLRHVARGQDDSLSLERAASAALRRARLIAGAERKLQVLVELEGPASHCRLHRLQSARRTGKVNFVGHSFRACTDNHSRRIVPTRCAGAELQRNWMLASTSATYCHATTIGRARVNIAAQQDLSSHTSRLHGNQRPAHSRLCKSPLSASRQPCRATRVRRRSTNAKFQPLAQDRLSAGAEPPALSNLGGWRSNTRVTARLGASAVPESVRALVLHSNGRLVGSAIGQTPRRHRCSTISAARTNI